MVFVEIKKLMNNIVRSTCHSIFGSLQHTDRHPANLIWVLILHLHPRETHRLCGHNLRDGANASEKEKVRYCIVTRYGNGNTQYTIHIKRTVYSVITGE